MNRNKDVRTALFLRGVWISARPVIWYGFFIAVILKYVVFGEYEVRITHFLVYVAAAFIILVPVFSGWITHALRMRPFCGRVEEIKKKQILVTDSTVRRKGGDLYHTPKVIIYVRGTNDRVRRFPINNPSFVDIDYIKKGDYVRHPWGSDYLEKLRKSGDSDVLCVVCGTMNRMESNICYNCRHSLLKDSDYGVL